MSNGALAAVSAAAGGTGFGLPVVTVLLTGTEAGLPIPIPSDLVILVLGERASAGDVPVLAVVVALELVAVLGTAALFLTVRGPGRALVTRLGP